MEYRVGLGFDSHKYTVGNGLVLGGVLIPCKYSFKAHSDGDIVIHSIIDAIMGALPDIFNYQNIGSAFPDNDPQYKSVNSVSLLNKVLNNMVPWKIFSCDIVIIMEKPKLGNNTKLIIDNLIKLLDTKLVNVKPKTSEGMGLIGKSKAATSLCIIKLYKEG
jgi:2-C-methyl-D-erythritol 4-phosphate cytidylyltransferase/2-C-methyl-D-erythritol 2,4-cyclodiphosphate synthase